MIEIPIKQEHTSFIEEFAEKQTIGGFSNLASDDLKKATRLDFQMTGVAAELGWYLYRYNNFDKLKNLLEHKFQTLRPAKKGDGGFDDSITHNNKTRFVDVKSSHVESEDRIKYLNLVIPPREFHQNMIYVCAFCVGKTRQKVDKVILAGWEINECITKKWKYDPNKYCVPVNELRPMKDLEKYLIV